MGKKFIFIKDIEELLEQGKTQIKLPEGTRLSPAAWDMVRENNLELSFTGAATPADNDIEKLKSQETSSKKPRGAPQPGLTAVASAAREVSGTVGNDAVKAPFFLIFDMEGRLIDIIKNPFSGADDDAGLSIANLMATSQVSAIVAQKFDSAIKSHLDAKKVQYFEIPGQIQNAVNRVLGRKS